MLLYEEQKRVSVIVDHVERLFYLVLKEYTKDLRTENFRQDATLAEFLRVGKRSADADAARPTISCGGCYVYLATWAEMG